MVQEGTVCQYVNNIKAGVIPGTLASFATGSFNTSGAAAPSPFQALKCERLTCIASYRMPVKLAC